MLRRIEFDEPHGAIAAGVPAAESPEPVGDPDLESGLLPDDHPRWVNDAVAISKAARELLKRIRPVFVAVRSFWDHRLRCIAVGGRRLSIDASGSYRIEL